MMHTDTLTQIIQNGLPCEHLDVSGDGHHFEALIVSTAFIGKTRVQRQQLVNAVLRAHFDTGELHALSMQTQTPEEWKTNHG